MLDRVICVERRVENSRRAHFNLAGDRRPRLIVWPEYDGLCKDEFETTYPDRVAELPDDAWGAIIAEALGGWMASRSLRSFAFRELVHGALPLSRRMARALQANPPRWHSIGLRLDAELFSAREHAGHDPLVFLCARQAPAERDRQHLVRQPTLDRATLLPYGEAIFQLGVEEAVVELCLRAEAEEEAYLRFLGEAASERGHRLERTDRHFLSHWVTAAQASFGPGWDHF